MRTSLTLAIFCLVLRPAFAETQLFDTWSSLTSTLPDLTVEDFETPFSTDDAIQFDGFRVSEESNFAKISSRTDYVSAGERALGFTWNGNQVLTFEFSPPITVFAADIIDFGTCCGAETLRVTSDVGGIDTIAATGVNRPRGNIQFFGVSSTVPFSKLEFVSEAFSNNDLIIFDQVSYRAVATPEPHYPVGMLVLGMFVLRRFRRLGAR